MIGIINSIENSYIIAEEIRKKYPTVDIYICPIKEINEAIDKLKNKGCKIIILPENSNLLEARGKYKELSILNLEFISAKELFLLDSIELIKEITKGNMKEVQLSLEQLKIPNQKKILLNNPKLLLIKKIISSKYQNQIVTSIDYLLEEIEKIIIAENINCENQKIMIAIY